MPQLLNCVPLREGKTCFHRLRQSRFLPAAKQLKLQFSKNKTYTLNSYQLLDSGANSQVCSIQFDHQGLVDAGKL